MSSCQVTCKRRDWKRINICHFPENHRQMYQVFHACARPKHDFKASLPYEEGPFEISWLPAACLEVRGPPQRLRCAFGSAGSAQGAAGGSWGAAAFPGAEQQESAGMSVHVSSRWGLGLHCCFEEKKGRWCLITGEMRLKLGDLSRKDRFWMSLGFLFLEHGGFGKGKIFKNRQVVLDVFVWSQRKQEQKLQHVDEVRCYFGSQFN